MMRDTADCMQVKRVISPVSVADNTAQVGQVINSQGYSGLTYLVAIGSVADADATFAVLLEESDDNVTFTAVDDADMISQTPGTAPETAAAFKFDSDDQVRKLGYIGRKQYTRLTITPANNASAALFSAMAVLGEPDREPVTQAAS